MNVATVIRLTRQNVREMLDRALAKRGADFVYKQHRSDGRCLYVDEKNQPSCLVGEVLVGLGMPKEQFDRAMPLTGATFNSTKFDRIMDQLPIEAEDKAVLSALSKAQWVQDSGGTWGEAHAAAMLSLGKTSGS